LPDFAQEQFLYCSPNNPGKNAPELTGERTFVPLNFFKQVTMMNNAYVFEAQIVIDNGEVME
jgi:hypothetical protein